jgi:hypothetical protein
VALEVLEAVRRVANPRYGLGRVAVELFETVRRVVNPPYGARLKGSSMSTILAKVLDLRE